VLQDEIRQLLRELVAVTGAERIAIVHDPESGAPGTWIPLAGSALGPPGAPGAGGPVGWRVPLGKGTYLQLERTAAQGDAPDAARPGGLDMDQRMAVERAVRAIRAAVRRWQEERAPALSVTAAEAPPPPRERVRERIRVYLKALAGSHDAANVLVTLHGAVLASSTPVEELQRARIPFTLRRVAVEVSRSPGRSHAELAGDDFYAVSFWFGACLIAFFSRPYGLDFFRHRARMVIRELSQLLPMMDDEPPPGSAQQAPIPE
jgi:hypothetical protein